MKKFSLFLSAMLISMMSFAQGVTHDVVVENATTSPVGQNIVLSGAWEGNSLTISLWQGGATQGFGTYAAEDYAPIFLGTAELTPKAEGVYTDKGDGTFTFTCTATDATDTYNISMKGALPTTGGSEPVAVEATTAFNVENGELYVDVCEADYAWCLQFTISEYDGYGEYDVAGLYSTDNDFNVSGKLTVSYDEAKETDKIVGTLKTADNSLTVLVTLYKGAAEEEEIQTVPVTISNLTTTEMPVEGKTVLQLMGSNDMEGVELMLFIPNYTGEDKEYALDLTSYYLTLGGTELTLVEGALTKSTDDEKGDVFAGRVVATAEEEGETLKVALDLTMWSTPAIDIEIEDVTITVDEESAIAFFNADWEGTPLSVEVSGFEEVEFKEYIEATLTLGDDVNWVDAAFGPVAVIIEDGVASLEGEFTSFATGKTYNVTLSGKLPVAEPTTITYELNGGELPKVKVPTNAELWGTDTADVNGLMHYFNHYHNLKRSAQDISADVSTNPVATFLTGMPDEAGVFVDEESKYKWLGDYIIKVTNDQIAEGTLSVLKAVDSNIKWRYGVQAFFMCLPATDSNYKGWADFTEAGKPEAWGAAYQAAHAVVLPTEPVAEDYVLPTPVKDGFTFVGWYDNAEGTGEAYTVIPAGWAGTLYAIWEVEGPATALDNIAIEGKVVKTIINGQLIIIKNGVQYNAQGAVVK